MAAAAAIPFLITNPAHAAKAVFLQPAPVVALGPTGVFQSLEFATNATAGLGSWKSVQSRIVHETKVYRTCDEAGGSCPSSLRAWRAGLAAWRGLSPKAKLIQVNRFVNAAIAYTDDRAAFRKADYWATPAESLKGRGDCEDYALLKYVSLRELGFRDDELRIVVVKDLRKGIGHAVLSVRLASGTFILDNQDSRVLRHDSIARYAPIYSINAGGRWINIPTQNLKTHTEPAALVATAEELGETTQTAAAAEAPAPVLPAATPPQSTLQAAITKPVFVPVSIAAREPDANPARPIARKLASIWPPLHWLLSRLPV